MVMKADDYSKKYNTNYEKVYSCILLYLIGILKH